MSTSALPPIQPTTQPASVSHGNPSLPPPLSSTATSMSSSSGHVSTPLESPISPMPPLIPRSNGTVGTPQPAPRTSTSPFLSKSSPSPPVRAMAPPMVEVESGPGLPFGDIALYMRRMEKVSNEDARTRLLFETCFPTISSETDRNTKKHLRMFSGFPNDQVKQLAETRLRSYENDKDLLQRVSRLLELSSDGDTDEIIERLLDYLSAPFIIVKPPKGDTTAPIIPGTALDESNKPAPIAITSASGTSGAPGSGSGAPRRKRRRKEDRKPPNAYLLFANDKRESITSSQPELQMMEVNRILGQMWSATNEAERAPYVATANQLKVQWEQEHPDLAAQYKRKKTDFTPQGLTYSSNQSSHTPAAGMEDGSDNESEMSDVNQSNNNRDTPTAPGSGSGSSAAAAAVAPASRVSITPLDGDTHKRIQSSVARILATSDLNTFSMRLMKAALAKEFSEPLIQQHAQTISKIVDEELIKMPDDE